MSMATQQQFALIGAGPAGLAGARALSKHGIAFQGFEAHTDVGGLWNIGNERSTVYPSHRELLADFQAYAQHFDLKRHFRFGVRVKQVEPVSDAPDTLWRVTLDVGGGQLETHDYKGVVIANGILAEPNMPKWPGQFSGQLLHTSAYKKAEHFKGQRVLIVGAGNSGCDIAVDAVHHAQSVDISVRRGYYFVPKYVFGLPADTVGGKTKLPRWLKQKVDSTLLKWFTGDPVRFGFPKPDYKMYESHPIVNSLILHHIGHGDVKVQPDVDRLDGHTVHFKDGSQADYDLVMAATGYKLHYPFINNALLNWQGMSPQLYLNIFAPRFDRLAVLGMVEAAGLGWEGRAEQAEVMALYFKGLDAGQAKALAFSKARQGPSPDLSGGYRYLKVERMACYVNKDVYRDTMRQTAAELA